MTCRVCSASFEAQDRGQFTVAYCSSACRKQQLRIRSLEKYRRGSGKSSTCLKCKKTFTPKVANRNQFCSVLCRNRANRRPADLSKRSKHRSACAVFFPTCIQCQRPFATQLSKTYVCSDACSKAHEVLSRVAAHTGRRTCKECSRSFPVEYRNKTRFCSDECGYIAKHRAKRKARTHGSKGSGRHRKRARKHGVGYEPIRLATVLERDGWVCGICTEPISRAATYPDPMQPSLDHIVPMSKGGSHTYSNVQAAHHRCNTLKRDTSPQHEQVA